MQRKKIAVGEAYAVTDVRGQRAWHADKVKGTVVSLTAEYEKSRSRYSRLKYTHNDGILVRFDEPVLFSYNGMRTLASALANTSYTKKARAEFKRDAVTEWVISDPRFVIEPWAEHEARQRSWDEAKIRREQQTDEQAAAFAPVLAATLEKLREAGFEKVGVYGDLSGISFSGGSITLRRSAGSDGETKATGFGYEARLETEMLLRLLGVESTADEEEGAFA